MKNVIFEKLKSEFTIEEHETLKSYCDSIWDVYETTIPGNLEPTIEYFFKLTKKIYQMFLGDKEVLYFNSSDPIYERLKLILKITKWNNIKKENVLLYVIDVAKIYPFKENKEDEFEVFILEDPIMFRRVYNYFSNLIHNT